MTLATDFMKRQPNVNMGDFDWKRDIKFIDKTGNGTDPFKFGDNKK